MSKGSLGKCHPDDVAWVSSLSEAELDFLVHLKNLIIQRATVIEGDCLIQKFDLRMLRAIGTILMDYFHERLKEISSFRSQEISLAFSRCNLTSFRKEESPKDLNPKSDAFPKEEQL